jgi:N-acyl-D-aspartate/D-glutamate deacylase
MRETRPGAGINGPFRIKDLQWVSTGLETKVRMSGREIVLRGGRVIDPESGYDAVADMAISDRRVVQIGAGLPAASADVNVAGLRHVLVNGAFVVRGGSIVPEARPGRPIRAEPR